MEIGITFNTIFQIIITAAVGFIGWSIKEFYNKIEKRQDATEKEVKGLKDKDIKDLKDKDLKELKDAINCNNKEMFKLFVTKDDHYRDINSIEKKIDGIKDILLDVKEDIGKLMGREEKK